MLDIVYTFLLDQRVYMLFPASLSVLYLEVGVIIMQESVIAIGRAHIHKKTDKLRADKFNLSLCFMVFELQSM